MRSKDNPVAKNCGFHCFFVNLSDVSSREEQISRTGVITHHALYLTACGDRLLDRRGERTHSDPSNADTFRAQLQHGRFHRAAMPVA